MTRLKDARAWLCDRFPFFEALDIRVVVNCDNPQCFEGTESDNVDCWEAGALGDCDRCYGTGKIKRCVGG